MYRLIILLEIMMAAQCPAETDTSMKIKSYSFTDLTFGSIEVIDGISCPDNSCAYLTVNGRLLFTDKSRIFKFDSNFTPLWMRNFDNYNIAKGAISLHSDSNLAFVLKSSSICPLVKLDSTSNSVIEDLRIGSARNCDSVIFSDDYSNIYVSGTLSSTPHVFKIGYADFGTTTITSIPISMNSVYSIHSYVISGQELLMISGSVTSPTQAYSLLSAEYDTGTQQWAKKLGCPTA